MRTWVDLLRVRQWTKNAFLLLPLLFSGSLLDGGAVVRNLAGFASFCLIASCVYVFNDLKDVDSDRRHPVKRNRPIASGAVSKQSAIVVAVICAAVGFALAFTLGVPFMVVALLYVANNVLYSLVVKRVVVLDVMSIAVGFVLRVFAGAFATDCVLSSWIILCMFMLALFLAIEKRRAEIRTVGSGADDAGGGEGEGAPAATRAVLKSYSPDSLKSMSLIAVALTILSYSLYTFSAGISEYMMVTIPFVVYGTFRYLLLAENTDMTEAPDKVLLTDKPILVDVLVWAVACAVLLYIG